MSRPRRVPRQASRQAALQVLYALDVGPEGASPDDVFEGIADHFDLPEGARAFAKELVCGVIDAREALDAALARHAHRWRVERMAAVDRNVLRLGAYEILRTDTPAEIAIDQAVALAGRFGSESSPGFVNGVLDALAREAGRIGVEGGG
jgi:N utilization substance protein B